QLVRVLHGQALGRQPDASDPLEESIDLACHRTGEQRDPRPRFVVPAHGAVDHEPELLPGWKVPRRRPRLELPEQYAEPGEFGHEEPPQALALPSFIEPHAERLRTEAAGDRGESGHDLRPDGRLRMDRTSDQIDQL